MLKYKILLFIVTTLSRILRTDDNSTNNTIHRRNHVAGRDIDNRKYTHNSKRLPKTVTDDPDHVDVNLRKKTRNGSKSHTGARIHVKRKLKCHCKPGDLGCKCSHGNKPATYNEHTPVSSSVSDDSSVSSASNESGKRTLKQNKGNAVPASSAPLEYVAVEEVKPGKNPSLDSALSFQNLMKYFRNYLPKVDNADPKAAMQKANDIINSEHHSPDDEEPCTSEELEELMSHIDNKLKTAIPDAQQVTEHKYKELRKMGVPHEEAMGMATEVSDYVKQHSMQQNKLADALKKSAYSKYVASNHRALQQEVEDDKEQDEHLQNNKIVKEMADAKKFPVLHPVHLTEEELAYLQGFKHTLSPVEIETRMEEAYVAALKAGNSKKNARAAAKRKGYLMSSYNEEIRKGVAPETAVEIIKQKNKRQMQVQQRRNIVQNNGPEIAEMMAEKTELIQNAVKKMTQKPENKEHILEELDDNIKHLEVRQAKILHDIANNEDIHKPRKEANNLINSSQDINSKLLDVAYNAPIVAKEIMKKGRDNARLAAKKFDEHLAHVHSEEMRHSPIPKSALRVLDEAKKENQLNQMAKDNAAKEKKIIDGIIKEKKDAEVMATEEELAKTNRTKKIAAAGKMAADNVLKAGGTIDEAKAVKSYAEQATAKAIERKEAAIRNDVLKSLSSGVDPKKAKQIAQHVATAHTGENAVGKTTDEVLKNESEARKKEALKNALYSDVSNENIDITKIIPADASEVSINDSMIKFPLKTFVDEKPRSKGEEYAKNRTDVLRNLVRNSITKSDVNSGLNKILTETGFLNAGENSNSITIENGVAYIKPSGKLDMENKGIDTSYWKPRHNQGERTSIPNGELYYEADIENAKLELPSPINKVPSTIMSNGNKQLDTDFIDELHIKEGTLNQTPWKDFSDLVHPKLNMHPNEEQKIKEANIIRHEMAEEKRKEALDSIKVYSFTNPSGDKHIVTVPQYGISETFDEEDGMKRLSHVDPDKNVAISETPAETPKEPLINSLEDVADNDVLNAYIEKVMTEGNILNKTNKIISSINGFTNTKNQSKSDMIQEEKVDLEQYLIKDETLASNIKNELINKSDTYSKQLNMGREEYINKVKSISDSVIYDMVKYNSEPEKGATDILDAKFTNSLSKFGSNSLTSRITNMIFNTISKITGQPNNVSANTVEKHVIPNLKAVQTLETTRNPNGRVTQTTTTKPPTPGTTVVGQQITKGTPRVPTGTNTSFPLQNPLEKPARPNDMAVRNGSSNPLIGRVGPIAAAGGVRVNAPGTPNNVVPPARSPQTPPTNEQNYNFNPSRNNSRIQAPNQQTQPAYRRQGQRPLGIASSPQS